MRDPTQLFAPLKLQGIKSEQVTAREAEEDRGCSGLLSVLLQPRKTNFQMCPIREGTTLGTYWNALETENLQAVLKLFTWSAASPQAPLRARAGHDRHPLYKIK